MSQMDRGHKLNVDGESRAQAVSGRMYPVHVPSFAFLQRAALQKLRRLCRTILT
jgi:hypothetical protein